MKNITPYIRLGLSILLLITALSNSAQQKSEPKKFGIETKNGNNYVGKIISSDSVKVVFKSDQLGEITLNQADIKKIISLGAITENGDQNNSANLQATRYFFSPNGYGLKKGEGYYQNIWVMFNSFAIGLTDYFSVGGGTVPLFLFDGTPTPVWVTAKFSIPVSKDKFNLAAGVLAGSVLGESGTGFGIFYGIATLGSRDANLSLGVGYAFAGGEISNSPMLNLNGMLRVSPRFYLLSENYLFPTSSKSTLLLSFGARSLIRNVGLDYGLFIPFVPESALIAGPWLGITIPFGKKH
ncbi:MAG: hypothetical protein WCK18_06470 [Prolixibacteraceae bacterium]